MDLSMVGFDGLASSDPEEKIKLFGSGFLKQERGFNSNNEDDYNRGLKMAKTEDYSVLQLRSNSNRTISDEGQMLSFSITDSKTGALNPFYSQAASGYYTNTGYGSGGGLIAAGIRGPFTPSQWMELEHQALIYKYILANVAVPSNLLIPIKKALDSAGLAGFSIGPLRPTSLGWGGFHLGFSNNADPEPGRCRRTDGKKWRCSRDAVPDQKYCERHINRGRHRSRKPVEGQNGHSVSGPTSKLVPPLAAAAATSSSVVVPRAGGGPLKNLQQPGGGINSNQSTLQMNGIFLSKDNNVGERNQASTGLSMLSSNIGLKNGQFSVNNQRNPYNESTRSDFGSVFTESLLNPIQKNSSENLNNTRENNTFRNSVHHQFMDEWPKNNDNTTQLSISIPISTSDFMSSTSSPTEEKKLASSSSPLRLSSNHRQANWVPISWENSLGGPLGEVLHHTNHTSLNECKLSPGLNLMTEGWNNSSSPNGLASSPNGPLNGPFQRFGSQSNSSAGSSPRGVSASFAPLL